MIGVIADFSEHDVVCEFFELFKTPWEFYRPDQQYEVLLCAGGEPVEAGARLVIYYAGKRTRFDDSRNLPSTLEPTEFRIFLYKGMRIPIYGDAVIFSERGNVILTDDSTQEPTAYIDQTGHRAVARVGYDLFRETRRLLTAGQPPGNASLPALDLHIAFLRDLMTTCGVSLVEIPPVPEGYSFIACLTHDVDHPSIRQHKWDHTMFGFLYRAIFGSLLHLLGRRISLRDLSKNWLAALKLPFVYLGLAKDFWSGFDNSYLELEKGLCSTFFVIPFQGDPGRNRDGQAPKFRASGYGAADIAGAVRKLTAAGSEIGLHGIDAWVDDTRGRKEFEEIRQLTGDAQIGVRMHWLYYDQQSPGVLEKAGAAYDSTIGYNGTVGYRAGTAQAYKPLEVTQLLELPLHVMDTALFYPAHLGLSVQQATTIVGRLVDNAVRFGGCLTVNWHDRSTAPERMWGTCYRSLLQDLKTRSAWFSTARQAVCWFRKRRSVMFETNPAAPYGVHVRILGDHDHRLPGLRLRVHNARESRQTGVMDSQDYIDVAFVDSIGNQVPQHR